MTTYDWTTTLNRGLTLFTESPGPNLEHRILEHFKTSPTHVHDLIEAIGKRVAAGTVHSGWAILDRELAREHPTATVNDNAERTKQLRLAEQWIRNTGGYYDREDELHDELFGHRGRLRHWPDLQPRILELWRHERHRFVQADLERDQRAHRYVQQGRPHEQHHRPPRRRPTPGDPTAPETPQPTTTPSPLSETIQRPLAAGSDGLALVGTAPIDDAYLDTIRPDEHEAQ